MYKDDHEAGQNPETSYYSNPVKAGKRTYFFDVRATRGGDYYVTITESKRRIDENGQFSYDKHKIFLYKEDFEKFSEGLRDAIAFIQGGAPKPDAGPGDDAR